MKPRFVHGRNILKRYGYQVLEAKNGVEALEVWAKHKEGLNFLQKPYELQTLAQTVRNSLDGKR